MLRHAIISNQWSVGIGLRRSSIIGENRWQLWFNLGFRSVSFVWGHNARSGIRRRWGLKSKKQLPLFMVWDEYLERGEVVYACVVFDSLRSIGI